MNYILLKNCRELLTVEENVKDLTIRKRVHNLIKIEKFLKILKNNIKI